MLVSILLHVVVFFALDQMKIAFKFEQARELSTRPINVSQIQVRPMDLEKSLPPENVIQPPKDSAALLDEVELLDILPKDQEIDIKPAIVEAEYALQMNNPAKEGNPEAAALEISAGLEVDADVPELGREPVNIKPAEIGQMTVDPGAVLADDNEIGRFTDDLIKRGANGMVENGTLDGVISLDSLLDLPANILLSKKTMLPSDLLFEFNSSELRESAKVGLMKLGLLMDRNPGLFCWIEGHTDLVGGDEFNLNLSIKRAEAVKIYLVTSLRMDRSKIITRGFGRYEPIIITGTSEDQSANRRGGNPHAEHPADQGPDDRRSAEGRSHRGASGPRARSRAEGNPRKAETRAAGGRGARGGATAGESRRGVPATPRNPPRHSPRGAG